MTLDLSPRESAVLWSVSRLNDLHLLRATFVTYAFKRHLHDYFVIGMVESGVQRFAYGRETHVTPPSGLIVINPGEPHTGEAAVEAGFRYRALYPDAETMQRIASEIAGRPREIPFFAQPVFDDPALFRTFQEFHRSLETPAPALEHESNYLHVLAQLVLRHAERRVRAKPVGQERAEIRRLRRFIHDNYAQDITLSALADLVHWSPYYLLRAFRNTVGLPPHAYLETVRVREAQRRLQAGMPLAQVAYETGFSSQSHFTTTFRQVIGVTPGRYAPQVNILKDSKRGHRLS